MLRGLCYMYGEPIPPNGENRTGNEFPKNLLFDERRKNFGESHIVRRRKYARGGGQ